MSVIIDSDPAVGIQGREVPQSRAHVPIELRITMHQPMIDGLHGPPESCRVIPHESPHEQEARRSIRRRCMGLTQVDLVTSTEAPEVVRTRDAQAPCHLEGIEHRTGLGRRAPDAEVLGPEHREIEGTDVVTDDDPAIEGLVEGIGMLDEPPCTSNIRIEDAMDAGGPSRDAHTGIDERVEVDGGPLRMRPLRSRHIARYDPDGSRCPWSRGRRRPHRIPLRGQSPWYPVDWRASMNPPTWAGDPRSEATS